MEKTQDEEYFQSWSKTHRWKFFFQFVKINVLDEIEKINNFVVINSQFWTVWKSNSTVLEPQRETGKLTISQCPMEEALWIGDSYAISKWLKFLHFELVISKTTLSTTQKIHYQPRKNYTINYTWKWKLEKIDNFTVSLGRSNMNWSLSDNSTIS